MIWIVNPEICWQQLQFNPNSNKSFHFFIKKIHQANQENKPTPSSAVSELAS